MYEKILYADDEVRYRTLIRAFLEKNNYKVDTAENGQSAYEMFCNHSMKYDLIILDIMMPQMDGWETCKLIRQNSDIPILMLTALGDEIHEIHGINTGADDYISKPFSYPLLLARIDALIRRKRKSERNVLTIAGLALDEAGHEISLNGKALDLTPREYNLLLYLAKNLGQSLSREQILDRVWGYDYNGDTRTIDTHIKSLRSKLGDIGPCIKTIYRYGYKFEEMKS
jgi:DNA-binding response OmpR family regulator